VTFRPGPSGEAMVQEISVPTDGALSAIAITEEPAGGSPQPTSPIYVVSKLGA
jgi:anti-sigma-K factor RskA